jgi:hypothetical protein
MTTAIAHLEGRVRILMAESIKHKQGKVNANSALEEEAKKVLGVSQLLLVKTTVNLPSFGLVLVQGERRSLVHAI